MNSKNGIRFTFFEPSKAVHAPNEPPAGHHTVVKSFIFLDTEKTTAKQGGDDQWRTSKKLFLRYKILTSHMKSASQYRSREKRITSFNG